jgi:hypothetical protein
VQHSFIHSALSLTCLGKQNLKPGVHGSLGDCEWASWSHWSSWSWMHNVLCVWTYSASKLLLNSQRGSLPKKIKTQCYRAVKACFFIKDQKWLWGPGVPTAQLCCCSAKTHECSCVPIKLYSHKQAFGHIGPSGHSLLTPVREGIPLNGSYSDSFQLIHSLSLL